MEEIAVSLKDISISYSGKSVVNDVNLDILSGEVFGLMGLNGVGKTSIIKVILGLKNADNGDVLIFGEDNKSNTAKLSTAYLPEKFDPPWFLTAIEFIRFSLSLYNRDFDKEKVFDIARKLSLDEKVLDKRANTYSKGMRQKLGIMGTILTNSPLFILDEPMSGLDPMARFNVKKIINEMKKRGHTIFLSSHILADMDEICDRVAVLNGGKINYIGTPRDLKFKVGVDNLEQAFLEFIEM